MISLRTGNPLDFVSLGLFLWRYLAVSKRRPEHIYGSQDYTGQQSTLLILAVLLQIPSLLCCW